MDDEQRSLLIRSFSHYSSSPGLELRYGVQGFVGDESVLRSAAYRIGILAALRSMESKSVAGVMITACGRSGEKNGVRIVDPEGGGALIADWEPLADSVANAVDPDEFVTLIEECVKKENISFDGGQPAEVLLGRDTSPSGEALLEAAKQGISSVVGTIFHDMGILTTPQLYWLVNARNKGMKASEHDYFQQLSSSYRCLVDLIPEGATTDKIGDSLAVDGANGVGGDKIIVLKDLCDGLSIEIRNTSKSGAILDQGVGVDFIQEQKIVPSGFGSSDIGFRCASLDGDADRILYFFVLPTQEIEIVGGDKILFLFTLFINEQLTVLEEDEKEKEEGHYHARLGILQSAYEIGASTNYLKSLGLDVVSFPTGTRNLHAVASKYDIGIYFEADGYGGILFSEKYLSWLEAKNNELLSSSKGSRKQLTVSRLLAVSRLMNTTVSDALASLLLVEAILQHNGWSLHKWNEIYCDLANRQLNAVENPKIVAVSHSGTKEEADTLIDEARSEDAKDGSHISQYSENIDTGPTGSTMQQVVDYEAHTVEQTDVDSAVELEQNQEQGTTTYVQACENETHTGFPEELQENYESDIVGLQFDEAADENKKEASVEEESQDNCIKKRLAEERKHEFNAELEVSLKSHTGVPEDSCPAKVLEEAEEPNHVIDKEGIEIKRGEADDDAWVLIGDGKGECLNAGPVMTDTGDHEHLPELGEPSNEILSCSSPEVNCIHARVENVYDLLVSADTDKAGVISGSESPCDVQPQSQTSSGVHLPDTTDYEHLPELDEPLNEKESCGSSPKINGIHAPVENVDNLLVSADTDKAEEAGVISGAESACDAQPQSQTNNGVHLPHTRDYEHLPELDKPSNEKESSSSPKVNCIHPSVECVDDLLVSADTEKAEEAGVISGTEFSCDAQPQSQTSSGVHLPDTRDCEHLPELDEPSNEKEICLSPKVNGIRALVEDVDDLVVSADTDKAEEAGVISGPESACDAQPQSQTSRGVHLPDTRDYEHLPELDEPSKESYSSPKVNGIHAPVENMDDLLVSSDTDKAEEAGVISGLESACDTQPQSQTSIGAHLPDTREYEHVPELELSNEKENCSSPKVNGILAPAEDVDDLLVSADTDKTEEARDISVPESACDAQPESQTSSGDRVPSVIAHDEQLETKAQNDSVDVDNGSTCLENGMDLHAIRVGSCSDGNDMPIDSGEALPVLSDVGTTEETGDLNVVGYASSCMIAPSEVNGILVTHPPSDHVAKVEIITENSPVDIDNDSNCLVNGKSSDMSISSEVNTVEASVEKLKNLPIPSDVEETEEAGTADYGVGIEPPSHIDCSRSSTLVHDNKLDCEVENGVLDVENGIDVNLPVDRAEELSNTDDVVQVERSVVDGAGSAKHDSEVNGGISGPPLVQLAEPEIESENDPAEVENESESTIDNVEAASSPCLNKTAETEVTNEFESVPDIQPPSQINASGTALYPSSHHGKSDNQAVSSLLDAQEMETINNADGTAPQNQVNSHDAQETYMESKAENTPVNGDIRPDCLISSASLNTNIRFGSLEFVGNVCPKSEAPITGSRYVGHDDSASSDLGKAEENTNVIGAFDEVNSQQHVADNHCEHKVEETLFRGSSDFPHDDSAMSTVANTEGDINEGIALNGIVGTVGANVDEESTSSLEGSATAVFDGESVGDEIVKKPFYYLIRIPKYDDEKLTEQIKLAEKLLEEKTRNRDAVLTEYKKKKETCQQLRANQQAAILEEKAARELFKAKRKEIDSAQSLVNIAKDVMTIEDLDNKIASMDHTIQHETVSLNEEKKLIREIKQSKQLREQLIATTKKQGVQQALDEKAKNEDLVKVLRKEMDALRVKLSEADQAVVVAKKRLDSEHTILNDLHRRFMLSNDVRQEAYSNLRNLRSQWSEKNNYFWSCKSAQRQANSYASSSDKASLQSACVNQVESVMKMWNLDNEFRKDYIRCNLRSTLRRLGTSDGRSLGPDEEAPTLAVAPVRRIIASVKDSKEPREAAAQPEPVAESRKADTKSVNKVVEQKKPSVVTSKPNKASSMKNEEAPASNTVKIEEDKEEVKASKEQEELARKAAELRKREEAVRLKEIRRLEEKAKFQEALERKRKKAEKAQAKAELRAKKEAEEREKEREKRAKKKENKRGLTAEDTTSNPDSEPATNPDAPEPETREKTVTLMKRAQKPQYAKQNKLKTILPPPPPLRNRGRRRTQQWVWVAVTIVAILILFFLGNLNLPEIKGVFSSWY